MALMFLYDLHVPHVQLHRNNFVKTVNKKPSMVNH